MANDELDLYIPDLIKPKCTIYKDYKAVLTLTNILKKNNKFYILQLLEYITSTSTKSTPIYFLFHRYGRIGNIGEIDIDCYMSLETALIKFHDLFETKTGGIKWADKNKEDNYISGNYIYTELKSIEEKELDKSAAVKKTDEELDIHVSWFIELIYSTGKNYSETVKDLGIDSKKIPFGSISSKQIKKANNVLNNISDILNSDPPPDLSNKTIITQLTNLTSDFYSIIPTYIGKGEIDIINDLTKLQTKIDLLNLLSNADILYKNTISSSTKNIMDLYLKLNSNINYVCPSSEDFKIINQYLHCNKGSTHKVNLEIVNIFEINRHLEAYYTTTKDSYLLWHGTNILNSVGIITSGLQIFESAKNGSMFGRGLYFANVSTKSAGYLGYNINSEYYTMFLCEVQLDNLKTYTKSSAIKDKTIVCHGVGQNTPDPSTFVNFKGMTVPIGKLIPSNISTALLYDEFIIYDESKVRLRYVVTLKVKY